MGSKIGRGVAGMLYLVSELTFAVTHRRVRVRESGMWPMAGVSCHGTRHDTCAGTGCIDMCHTIMRGSSWLSRIDRYSYQ
jgi:hypothetical protein